MKSRQFLPCIFALFCLFSLTTPAFATDNATSVPHSTTTDYPLNDSVFQSSEFLFIRRKGTPITPPANNSDRITTNSGDQLVTQEMIWSTDQIDLLDGEAYYAKVQFQYDYETYSDKELWLHINLPKATTTGETSHLSATLALVDPSLNEVIAQINQQIALYTPDTDQTLKFYARLNYISLPDMKTTPFLADDLLTSDDNLSIRLPTTSSKGIILFDFCSNTTLPPLFASTALAAWNTEFVPLPITPDYAENVNINDTTLNTATPTAPDTSTPNTSAPSEPSINPAPNASLSQPFSLNFRLHNFSQLSRLTPLTLKIIAFIALTLILFYTRYLIQAHRRAKLARIRRRERYYAHSEAETTANLAELARLFDDRFLDFDKA